MIMIVVYSESVIFDFVVLVDFVVNGGVVIYIYGSVVGGGGDKYIVSILVVDLN